MQKNYYQAILTTKLGPMIAIADDEALCLLEFVDRRHLPRQMKRLGFVETALHLGRSKPIDRIEHELQLYFADQLTAFNTPLRPVGSAFQQQVWAQLQKIPYGKTYSYLQLAQLMGKPSAYRAVANANGANALAIIIPCHRVINHNGALGGYAGGLSRKIELIKHENKGNL